MLLLNKSTNYNNDKVYIEYLKGDSKPTCYKKQDADPSHQPTTDDVLLHWRNTHTSQNSPPCLDSWHT